MTEEFALRFCSVDVSVESRLAGLREACVALLGPAIEVADTAGDAALHVVVDAGARTRLSAREADAMRRFPSLRTGEDGATFTLIEYAADRRVALRHEEPGSEELHLAFNDADRTLAIGVEHADAHFRGVVRVLKLVLGALVRQRGAVVLHGSLVTKGDHGLVLLGPRGSGKSSLAFVLASRCGWRFVSDDLIFAHLDGSGALVASGWPSRIAVATNLLLSAAQPIAALRRYPEGPPTLSASPWQADARERVYLDADELIATFGISTQRVARPTGVVFPRAREELTGWRAEAVAPPATWLDENGATIRQLQHSTDHLGLLGGLSDRVTTATSETAVAGLLAALPCVAFDYGPRINDDPERSWADVLAAFPG